MTNIPRNLETVGKKIRVVVVLDVYCTMCKQIGVDIAVCAYCTIMTTRKKPALTKCNEQISQISYANQIVCPVAACHSK